MFDHIVKISEEESKLYIYRMYEGGRQELFTSVELPKISFDSDTEEFRKFAQQLGENILIDSPIARKALSI